jgi:7-cyano-7-deazaguanine synthase
MKTLAIVSGGMDSVTMLHDLYKQGHELSVVSFNYGQRHIKELEVAKRNADKLGLQHKIIRMDFLAQLLDNSALTGDTEVPEGHYAAENMKLTVVPNRNMIMASIAIGLAVNNGQDAIAMGVHSGDHAIYPDCRPEFISALRTTSLIANYEPIDVLAPYLKMDKSSIIARGLEIDTMDYSETWTCYKGLQKACGVCGSCQERLEGFANNNIANPLDYVTRELINGSN